MRVERQRQMDGSGKQRGRVAGEPIRGACRLEGWTRVEKQREMDGFGKQKKRVASESIHGGMPLEGITRQLFLLIAPPQSKQFPIEFVT